MAASHSLNALFASWAVSVRNPMADLDSNAIRQIEDALGHEIRIVYAHI